MPLIALCLGFFMVMIDVTVVNVTLPSLAQDLQSGVLGLQWVVDGYTLTFACLLLFSGNLGDRVGAKAVFNCGLILFVLTSFGCAIASYLWLLIIFRFFQGIAAALVVPTSLALIKHSYITKAEQAKAIGTWGGIGGIAAATGPILGAILTTWIGWRAIFFINIPIGILGIWLTIKYVPDLIGTNKNNFDYPGQIFGIISIAALAFGLIEAGRSGWFSDIVIGSFFIFFLTAIFFIMIEARTLVPVIPLNFFGCRTFSSAIIVGMLLNIGFYGELFILPLYFQEVRGYSVLISGLAVLPQPGLAAVASYLGGRLTSYIGAKIPMIIGLFIGAIGFLTMLIAKEHTPIYFSLILPLSAIGFGTAFTMPAATIAAIHAAPVDCTGVASGAFNTSRQIGSLIGVAMFGTIINTASSFIAGMHTTLVIAGIAFLCGCFITFIGIDQKRI